MELMVDNGRRKYLKIKRSRKPSQPPTKGALGTIKNYITKKLIVKEVEPVGQTRSLKRKQVEMLEGSMKDEGVAMIKLEEAVARPLPEGDSKSTSETEPVGLEAVEPVCKMMKLDKTLGTPRGLRRKFYFSN